MNLLGPFTGSSDFHYLMLVATYRFTKLTQIMPLYTIRAYDVAFSFCVGLVLRKAQKDTVITDNGKQFSSQFFQTVCPHFGIAKTVTFAYHPQANSRIQRRNGIIAAMLSSYANEHQDYCKRYNRALTCLINCGVHQTSD